VRLWPFRRRQKAAAPERVTAADLDRLAAAGTLARVVVTPPPAPRASADRVRESLAVLPVRPLGSTSVAASGAAAPARQSAAAVLVLDNARRVTVSGPGLVGRDPASAAPTPEYRHVIALDDPDKTLSRTHLEFGFGGDATFWVMDADSANGVELRRPGFPATMLVPRQRTVVSPNDVVVFGGHELRAEPTIALVTETPLG
jgi:hypothetical protein